MNAFIKEFLFHEGLSSLASKIHLVANKTDANVMAPIQDSNISQFRPVEAYVPFMPLFANIKNLNAEDINQGDLVTVLHNVMEK